jgi:NHL repeat-containing protein
MKRFRFLSPAWMLGAVVALAPAFSHGSFIGPLTVKPGPLTNPGNGDINPYGVAVVPRSTGKLVKGHVLVSNFNNSKNLQGTGTTISDVAPDGTVKLFAEINASELPGPCPGGVGLTTALSVLRSGWVIVGSLPTSDGTSATAAAGCLLVLNDRGKVVETLSGWRFGVQINGPWDMTALDLDDVAELFVTNVLNGTVAADPNVALPGNVVDQGTVVRIILYVPDHGRPQEVLRTVVGSGFGERTDPLALVIGPTGVALNDDGDLYVADTLLNRIAKISNAVVRFSSAGVGKTVSENGSLNGPLGLAVAPNGHILTVNSNDGNIVETTPKGSQVAFKFIDTSGMGAGTLFGLAIAPNQQGVYFVDDGDNTLDLLH